MLCSRCSEPLRPVVAIDIDGTLGDYHGHLIEFARNFLGRSENSSLGMYSGEQEMREWFSRAFDSDPTTYRTIKLAFRQGGLKRTMPPFPGASDFVKEVRSAGAEVWLTTTRPYQRLDSVDPDTRNWLERNGIQYDYLLYDEDKYKVLSERVDPSRVVAVLDDLVEQLDRASEVFGIGVPILRSNRYNSLASLPRTPHSADSMSAAQELILRRVKKWSDGLV